MQKYSQTVTKLQHKLFYRFHSNTILISKFRHFPTCQKLGIGAAYFALGGPDVWSKYILSNISVLGTHFK